MGKPYSNYCIKECPIGSVMATKLIAQADSAFDAVSDMQEFVEGCMVGCEFAKQREEYDKKENK